MRPSVSDTEPPKLDPLAALRARLQRLHRKAGEPSLREISKKAPSHIPISHTTVGTVLRCTKPPRWNALEAVVGALNGEIEEFRTLWVAVQDAYDRNGVGSELQKLLEDWHGSSEGATEALVSEIEARTGQHIEKRLRYELRTKSTWQVVQWVLEVCTDADSEVRTRATERIAGLWTEENYGRTPEGYTGRIILDGEIIREAIHASHEAEDVSTYAELLKQERDRAEELANQYKIQAQALEDSLVVLKQEVDRLNEESAKRTNAFAEHSTTFAEHLGQLRRELEDSTQATVQLRHEKRLLEQHEARLRIELDQARELADERYRQIEVIRQETEEARTRSERMIADLDKRNDELRSQIAFYQGELDNLRSSYDDASRSTPDDTHVLDNTKESELKTWGARTLAGRMANHRRQGRDPWFGTR